MSTEQLVTIDTPEESKSTREFWLPSTDFERVYSWYESRPDFEKVKVEGRDARKLSYPNSAIQVWSLTTGELIEPNLDKSENMVRHLQMTPDKKWLSSYEVLAGTFERDQPVVQRLLNLESNEWTTIPEVSARMVFSNNSQMIAAYELDESKRYSKSVVLLEVPSMQKLKTIELPEGVHSGNELQFLEDDEYLMVEYRTYDRKNVWNKWKTNIVCFDVKSGKELGRYEFPFDNDSPLFADNVMGDTLVMCSWRHTPKTLSGLSIPGLKPKWTTEVGDYLFVNRPVISPTGESCALLCHQRNEGDDQRNDGPTDWDLKLQNELKIVNGDGEVIETLVLPVGASSFAYNHTGDTGAIGAVGSAYLIDFADLVDATDASKR